MAVHAALPQALLPTDFSAPHGGCLKEQISRSVHEFCEFQCTRLPPWRRVRARDPIQSHGQGTMTLVLCSSSDLSVAGVKEKLPPQTIITSIHNYFLITPEIVFWQNQTRNQYCPSTVGIKFVPFSAFLLAPSSTSFQVL